MTIKRLFGTVGVALFLLLLVSCEKVVRPPLVFGANAWPGYEPVYLAGDLGYLPADRIHLAEYANAAEVRQAFRAHTLHLAAMTLEDALELRRDVPDLKIVLVFDTRVPGKTLDVLVARDDDIGDYHDEMVQLAKGWRRAMDYVHSDAAKATALMAKHEHLEPVQFDKAMQGLELAGVQRNKELLLGDSPGIAASINAIQRAMLNKGQLNIGVEPGMLLDGSLLVGIGP